MCVCVCVVCKEYLALYYLLCLICHKTPNNQPTKPS